MNLCHLNKETGRGLPDLSLILPLCKELNISVNELLSGEKLNSENYQEKLENNMVNIVTKLEKDNKKRIGILKKISFGYLSLCLIFLVSIFTYSLYNYEMFTQKYDKENMYIAKENDNFVFYSAISGNVLHKLINYNDENILLMNYKSSLNEINKHSSEDTISNAYCLNNIKNSEKIAKVYYTENNLESFDNLNEIKNLLEQADLIYEK